VKRKGTTKNDLAPFISRWLYKPTTLYFSSLLGDKKKIYGDKFVNKRSHISSCFLREVRYCSNKVPISITWLHTWLHSPSIILYNGIDADPIGRKVKKNKKHISVSLMHFEWILLIGREDFLSHSTQFVQEETILDRQWRI